jgi:periplasmic mercuric ion binding protein
MKTLQQFRLFALSCAVVCCFVTASSHAAIAQTKTDSVKVWGNCGMCKKTIEKSLKGASGIETATWNKTTKMLAVNYDPNKTNLKKVEEKVAAAGYDTQNVTANTAAYSKLPDCCQYDRKK